MRVPPIGALGGDMDQIAELTARLTTITHTDSLATVSACVISSACRLLCDEDHRSFRVTTFLGQLERLTKDIEHMVGDLPGRHARYDEAGEVAPLNSGLVAGLDNLLRMEPADAMRAIAAKTRDIAGQQIHPTEGFGPPGVAASLYFFLRAADEPKRALLASVNAGGDTDTVGAIVGALCGTLHGPSAFQEYLPELVALDLILDKVRSVTDDDYDSSLDLVEEETFLTATEESLRGSLSGLQ